MAVSAAVSINELVLLALKRAGLVPVQARLSGANLVPYLEHGRRLLDLIVDGLATKGFFARSMAFHDLTIVADTSEYALPETVLDVHEDAMFIPSFNGDTEHTQGETPIKQIDLSTWQTLPNKGSESSRPQLYAAFRDEATVTVRFWPVPSEAGTVRLKTARLLDGNATGTDSVDLQRYWSDALVWCLAYYFAVDGSMPVEKVSLLLSVSETKKAECVSYAFEHTNQVATVHYPTQWSQG